MTINQEMLDALKMIDGCGGLGPQTHQQLRILIQKAEVTKQEASVQEITALERLAEVTQSLRAFEKTPLTFDQMKRLKAMIHYNDLALSGARLGWPRRWVFLLGMLIAGLCCALGALSTYFF